MWDNGSGDHGYEKVATSPDIESPIEDVEAVETLDRGERLSRKYLVCLTISMGGLQVVWATVMAEGSTFLLSLGLPSYLVSLVWLAGPICGTLLQPYIGYKSDFLTTHPWGRRRPFMIYGTLATIMCINLLAWTPSIIHFLFSLFSLSDENENCTEMIAIQVCAVLGIWALNIAIQPVQTSLRALIVDICPPGQAVQGNSYASTAVIIGSAVGYGCGFIGLPSVLTSNSWNIENAEFKGLCAIASLALGGTVAVTACVAREKRWVGESEGIGGREKFGVRDVWGEILEAVGTLPGSIGRVCVVQFFAWLAWFPFLFNVVVYLSKLYGHKLLSKDTESSTAYERESVDSTQHAILAMLLFSIVALLANLLLPHLITTPHPQTNWQARKPSLRTRISWLTLPRAWMLSHILTAICLIGSTIGDCFMISAIFISFLGISWALTQWAPFAIITSEITSSSSLHTPSDKIELEPLYSSSSLETEAEVEDLTAVHENPAIRSRAGTTMGVHNIAIALPQMLSAVVNSAIFWGCRRLDVGDLEAMRWVLRVGGVAALGAAWAARGIR